MLRTSWSNAAGPCGHCDGRCTAQQQQAHSGGVAIAQATLIWGTCNCNYKCARGVPICSVPLVPWRISLSSRSLATILLRTLSISAGTSSSPRPTVLTGGSTGQYARTDGSKVATVEAALGVEQVVVVLAHNGHDGELGLDREVECAFLEWQHVRLRKSRTRAFWEHVERYRVSDIRTWLRFIISPTCFIVSSALLCCLRSMKTSPERSTG